jgi:hypothetical protein
VSHTLSDKLRRAALAAAAACCVAALAACGGGAAAVALVGGGVGTGGTGIAFGTVIGLGSVIVDGQSYSSATPTYYAPTSTSESAQATSEALELGAHVDLSLGANDQPATATVQPELQGMAQQVDVSTGTLTVNGMRVVVNSDPSRGPQTLYSGLTGLSNLSGGTTRVEVHGAYGIDASGPYLWATLIEQVPGDSPVTRLVGRVTAVSASSLTLDTSATPIPLGANTQVLLPAGASLAPGQLVYAWNNESSWVLRVVGTGSFTGSMQVSGLAYDVTGTTCTVSGIPVDFSALGSQAAPAQGQYVVASGQADGHGTLKAQQLGGYSSTSPAVFELHGTITGFVNSSSFLVRGTPVNAAGARFLTGSADQLGNGVYVDITGQVSTTSGNVIAAQTVNVDSAPPVGSTVDMQGTVQSVNSAGTQFVLNWQLQNSTTPVSVSLASNRAFNHGDDTNLVPGTVVSIEGTLTSPTSVDAYTVNFGSGGPAGALSASGRVYQWSLSSSVTTTSTTAAQSSTFMLEGNQLTIPAGLVIPAGFGDGADVEVSFSASGNIVQSLAIDN